MKAFFQSSLAFAFVLFFISLPIVSFAGPGGSMPPGTPPPTGSMPPAGSPIAIKIDNPLADKGVNTISDFLKLVINDLVLPIGALIAVLYIMYAGFLMVTARGDEGQLKDAKAAFTHAAIGTAILLGSWVIAEVIQTTVNSLTSS